MRIFYRISLWAVAAIVCLVAALALYLRNADLSVYEDEIEGYLSEKIGHRLEIDGRFDLQVRGLTTLTAEDISLSNPDWPSAGSLVSVGHLSVVFDLWSLVSGPLIIEDLDVREVTMNLERDAEGQANWITGRPVSDEANEIDTGRIAFRDVNIKSVQIAYVDPARRRPIDVAIEHLIVRPDNNDILDLDLLGAVNEFPLWADGKLGPWQNLLDGKDLMADLDVTLGQVRLAIEGSAEDTRALAGVEATIELGGPSIGRVADRLGLPPFAEGPFQIDGRVRKLDGGNQIRLEGNLGAISIFASGSVDRFLDPGATQLDFNFAGPDTRYVAEVFGIEGAPEVPFQVSGDLKQEGERLSFTATRAMLGENSVALDGWFDVSTVMPDMDATIKAAGPDFSVFAPFMNLKGIPAEVFDIDGRIEKSGASWKFSDVVGTIGDNRIAANGSIGDGADTEIEFSAAGPDISSLQALAGASEWPEKPFDISARIKPARGGVRVENGIALFGDNRINVDGLISTGTGLAGTQLVVRGNGSELHSISLLAGVPYLPSGSFDFSANVAINQDRLLVSDVIASAGDIEASADAAVGLGSNAGEFDLVVTANGSDVGDLGQIEQFERLNGEPFSLSGHFSRHGGRDELEFDAMQASIGDIAITADGTLSMQPLSNTSDLKFSLAGPDMDQFGRAIGTDLFVAKAFNIGGQFTGTPSGFAVRDLAARIGDNDVSGVFEIDLKDKPRFVGTLSSAYLDMTERLQQSEEQSEEAPAEEAPGAVADEFIFSNEPLDAELLQAADIEIDINIDQLRARALAVSDFHVGIKLLDGELQLDPISFTETQGSVAGQVRIAPSADSYMLDATLAIKDMHFGLTSSPDQDRSTLPPIGGDFTLRGQGNSLHELMASSNGGLSMRQGSGQIVDKGEDRLFGDMFLTILRTLNPKREKQVYREIHCGIYDVAIADGVATLEKFAVQSKTMTVLVVGNVDFNTEKLKLAIRAKPREGLGVSLGGSVNSFLRLGGTLSSPKLQIDPKGSAFTGGAAVATGGFSLLAKALY
ncbi:MAG: AsmA family protein, partial [Woeseiaceae bacterium]|nr:AsmA family protein [Woeseiaceae bacterium]MDX2607320.1 AsmA family protein [Woeseiaceae bacterium]